MEIIVTVWQIILFILTQVFLLRYSPTVPDVPANCDCTTVYSQPTGILLLINSTWDTVPVNHLFSIKTH